MKKIILFLILALAVLTATAQEKIIKPKTITPMPKMTKAEWQTYYDLVDQGRAPKDISKYGDLTVYGDLYTEWCSWYCGGEVKSVTASSCLKPIKSFNYKGENAHDFDHESVWATDGKGIGESLTYTFEGKCPRISTVKILNGHVYQGDGEIDTFFQFPFVE